MYVSRILTSSPRIASARALHVSTRILLAKQTTKGQAPIGSRQPEEHTILEQNPHLKHAKSSEGGEEGRDRGKGNAAPDPELPSRKLESDLTGKVQKTTRGMGRDKRSIHTTAFLRAENKEDGDGEHTAESYFKDVDETPPASAKTHRVDGGSDATHRPHEQYADPAKEYATVSHDEPYELPVEENGSGTGREKGEQKEQKMGYGGTKRDAARNAPRREEGPQEGDAGGMKPERND